MEAMIWEKLSIVYYEIIAFTGGNKIWILYPLSIFLILLLAPKKMKAFYGAITVLEGITIINPIVISILVNSFGFSTRYHRFFWMIISYIAVAYASVLVMDRVNSKVIRGVIVLAVVLAVVRLGVPVYFAPESGKPFVPRENTQMTKNANIELYPILHMDEKQSPKVVGDLYWSMDYRMYDASVRTFYERTIFEKAVKNDYMSFMKKDYCSDEEKVIYAVHFYLDFSVDVELFKSAVDSQDVDFILSTADELNEYLASCGYEYVGMSEQYTIWKVK